MTLVAHAFLVHALIAGTAVALLCGAVGYFLVLRREVFAGDALGHVAYTGAMAALMFGFSPRAGLFAAAMAAGVVLGAGALRGGADDVAIGSFFAWILGLGGLFLGIYTTHRSSEHGNANVNVLFGSIFGIGTRAAAIAVAIAVTALAVLLAIARPLLFATVDPAVARAAGVPVRLLGMGFLAVVGATVAEATQLVGAVVVLGLLTAPAATAARLTARPWPAFGLSAVLATVAVWAGIALSWVVPAAPAGFTVTAVAGGGYLVVVAGGLLWRAIRSGVTGVPARA
ncbi:metal ABC transporter permease [Nocardia aurantia]|uniref:High-affinity zinc uptake system membrane protein ZnuB n=1 Tax=Nocardia aurantia TaxID=2585199 RepID=A0A7K0DHM7_9NOCA|nr:metal ABC transporter permease [Nocardia aurantia]MQY24802.1 High-affinity zinc uptake system membrane protein ZnuB [Nocardia aurantia]